VSAALDEIAERATGVAVEEADPAKVMAVLDERARSWLGLSAEQFLAALKAGKYAEDDSPAVSRLAGIAALLEG
jgi:hypothetical protein